MVPYIFAYTVRDGYTSGTSPAVFAGNTEWLRLSCAVVGGLLADWLVHLVKRTTKGGNGYVRNINHTGIGTAHLRRDSFLFYSSGDGTAEIFSDEEYGTGEAAASKVTGGGHQSASGELQDDAGVCSGVAGGQPAGGVQVGDRGIGSQHVESVCTGEAVRRAGGGSAAGSRAVTNNRQEGK